MHVDIFCHHTSLTDALRDAVNQKLSKLDHHTDEPLNVHVVLTVEKNRQVAEATVNRNGTSFHSKAEAGSMYEAIDSLVDKLDRAMRKDKTKRLQRVRGPVPSLKQAAI